MFVEKSEDIIHVQMNDVNFEILQAVILKNSWPKF